jgi:hypothetical protein
VIKGGRLVVGRQAFLLMKMQPSLYIPDYGKVKVYRQATYSKHPPVKRYNDTQVWYNSILGIGAENEAEDIADSGASQSLSDRFRNKR